MNTLSWFMSLARINSFLGHSMPELRRSAEARGRSGQPTINARSSSWNAPATISGLALCRLARRVQVADVGAAAVSRTPPITAPAITRLRFAGATPGNVAVTTSGVGFRLRLAFAEVQYGQKFFLAAGQAFSLVDATSAGWSPMRHSAAMDRSV